MEYAAVARAGTTVFQSFLQRVFTWMLLGLATTGAVAGAIGSSDSLLTDVTKSPGLVVGLIVAMIAVLAFMGATTQRDLSSLGAISADGGHPGGWTEGVVSLCLGMRD